MLYSTELRGPAMLRELISPNSPVAGGWTRLDFTLGPPPPEDLGQITRVVILPQRVGLDVRRFSVSAED